jgi:hypothetical protein
MPAAVSPEVFADTILEFCASNKISRPALYKLWGQNRGPRSLVVNGRRLITREAAEEWRRSLETKSFEPCKAVAANRKRA